MKKQQKLSKSGILGVNSGVNEKKGVFKPL